MKSQNKKKKKNGMHVKLIKLRYKCKFCTTILEEFSNGILIVENIRDKENLRNIGFNK